MRRELMQVMNEQETAIAFSKQAPIFDAYVAGNAIIQYKRQRVREHVNKYVLPGSNILELNAGTGEDAVYFAHQGHRVHATDIASGMLAVLDAKVAQQGLGGRVTSECCSFTGLDGLVASGPYDHIFSNFAGLNCSGELDKILRSLPRLLKPGGKVTLVLLPGFCLWETLMVFKGHFRTATRRWVGSEGARSRVEGQYFRCWYYSPSYVRRHMDASFSFLDLEGLCTLMPPSYIEDFAEKHPAMYEVLRNKEDRWKGKWPWNSIGDYYIISFQKKE